MKSLCLVLVLLVASEQTPAKEKVKIGPLSAVNLTYEEFANYAVKLSNSSGKQIDVSVIDPSTNKQVSGFGLGPLGKAVLTIADGHVLKLKNNSMKEISLNLSFVQKEVQPVSDSSMPRIQFTLQNTSMKSIPLIIPNVMNPNLSPFSSSGVALEIGQKIYYKKGMKKILLLTVDETIKQGDKIDVAQMIKDLK